MILNSGLDNACTTNANTGDGFRAFVTFAAIGTGSTPPDATDLLLEAQRGSRSNSDGGFSNLDDAARDAGNNLMFVEQEFTRVFNISASVTVREWGLAPASTGNLTARDLFRDLSNNPTAIPLEDGDQLQLVIKLRVQAAWEYEPASFVITGAPGNDTNGTHDGVATVTSGSGTTYANIRDALRAVWPGQTLTNTYLYRLRSSQSGVAKDQSLSLTAGDLRTVTVESYVPGQGFRDVTVGYTPSEVVGDHYGWALGPSTTVGVAGDLGFRFILTDPPFLTKTDTERLVLTVRKHIARV